MSKEKTYTAIAKQFIKYDGKFIKEDEKFKVKASDVEELKNFAEIDIPEGEVIDKEDATGAGENGGE